MILNFKIKVRNQKESAEIQRILFKLGYIWRSGDKKVLYKENLKIGIFFELDKNFKNITYDKDFNYFKRHKNKEVTLKKLKSKEFQMLLRKMMILKSLE